MIVVAYLAAFVAVLYAAFYGLRVWYLREAARDRLLENGTSPTDRWLAFLAGPAPIIERYYWVCWIIGLAAFFLLLLGVGMWLPFALAIGVLIYLVTVEVEATIAEYRLARVETDLANAVDLMVGSLRAGGSLGTALESAAYEVGGRMGKLLQEVLERVRYGDDAETVLSQSCARVPSESYQLFAMTLAVNWRSGGALSPSLAAVGKSIRDRIEVGRRLRAMTVQTRFTMSILLFITYFIAYVMFVFRPDQVQAFLDNSIGALSVAAVILLQAVGIFWISRMTRVRY